jgi:aminoglycoside 6'-N-acetyltransferase I
VLRPWRASMPRSGAQGCARVTRDERRVKTVRVFQSADWPEWRRMRCALWPDHSAAEHEADMAGWLARSDAAVVVCSRASGALCGFAEAGSRPYADGCWTSPVAFLEGWYVDPDCRGSGVGRALVEAVEAWARERGFHELASDALLDNEGSHRAHERLGFIEVERAVRYRKRLS